MILICQLCCVWGIMHFIIQSALLDHTLVYHTSNFQIIAIVLTNLVKVTFYLQLYKSNNKLLWLASKKRIKVLGIEKSFLY